MTQGNDPGDSCSLDDDTCGRPKPPARGLFPRTVILHELMGLGQRFFQKSGDPDPVVIKVSPRD